MWLCDTESKENFKRKVQIQESEANLKYILEIFPSGIIFYNKLSGFFYKNKFSILGDITDIYTRDVKEDRDSNIIDLKESESKETAKVLNSLFSKDHYDLTLKDELERIYSRVYSN